MKPTKKQQVCSLLKVIETGDPDSVKVVNEDKYIQHNPLTREGNIGLAELFKRLAETGPKVDIVRVFEDREFVFAHTHYDFNTVEVGFEVFRFEDDQIVEHWDNLQSEADCANASGRTMLDGPTEATDLDKTEQNRALVRSFIDEVLVNKRYELLEQFIDSHHFAEHNPNMQDGLAELRQALLSSSPIRCYQKNHRILAEGSFVLGVCEGYLDKKHVSFYDLFRISNGKIVEHWDTLDYVPLKSDWVNDNGKF